MSERNGEGSSSPSFNPDFGQHDRSYWHSPAQSYHYRSRSRSPLPPCNYTLQSNGSLSPPLFSSTRTPSPSVASVTSFNAEQKFREQDLDHIILPPPPSAVIISDRPTCYSPEPPSPLDDFPEYNSPSPAAKSALPSNHYRQSFANATSALLDRCSKLPPLIARSGSTAGNVLPTPSASGSPSPLKSSPSFITSNSSEPSVAGSRASIAGSNRAKHASRASLFGDLLNIHGTSAPLNIGIIPGRSKPAESDLEEEQELRDEMDVFTRAPARIRPRRTSTQQSTSRFGSWFTKAASSNSLNPKPATTAPTDPLLTLDITAALFPHGTADPLNPSSFHDLLSTAESLLQRYQTAYRAKWYAHEDLRSEQGVQAEELEEAETRARHLKMQLEGMAARAGEQERAMEGLVQELEKERRERHEEEVTRRRSVRRVHEGAEMAWAKGGGSDSGFESEEGEEEDRLESGRTSPGLEHCELEVQLPARTRTLKRSNATRGQRQSSSASLGSCHGCAGGPTAPSELRAENQRLRIRVSELEDAVDSCLDMVAAL